MFTWLSKKDRKIRNLEAMIKNRDKLIDSILKQNKALSLQCCSGQQNNNH